MSLYIGAANYKKVVKCWKQNRRLYFDKNRKNTLKSSNYQRVYFVSLFTFVLI